MQHQYWFLDICPACHRTTTWRNVRFLSCRCGYDLREAHLVQFSTEVTALLSAQDESGKSIAICARLDFQQKWRIAQFIGALHTYQHPPQACHLSNVLHQLSEENTQIIITTHSPHFVSGEAFEDVRVGRRVLGAQHSVVCSYDYVQFSAVFAHAKGNRPLRAQGVLAKVHQVLQPALNEMFFAQRLVLVEGLEDVAYIHSWLMVSGRWSEFRRRGIHIVPANGKHALLHPLIIAKGLGIPTLLIFDADADVDKNNQDVHQSDNTALLRVVGGDDTVPFPPATVWSGTHIVWSNNMGASIKEEVDNAVWIEAANYASAQCGMAGDLNKNALHIGARLTWLWEHDHKPAALETLCNMVITFA